MHPILGARSYRCGISVVDHINADEDVDQTYTLFPLFTTDYGQNIHVGKNVFINSGCRFQDQGGVPAKLIRELTKEELLL